MVEQHERRCGKPKRAVGDHLYGSQDCLGYLQDKGIETVIPQRKGGNKHGGVDKSKFAYDSEQDVYRCPAGEILRRRRTQRKNRNACYSTDPEICRSCSLRSQCVSSSSSNGVRQVTRFDTPYVEQAQAACARAKGRRLLKKRQTCMEGLFGQGKTWHGLKRARWRGVVKLHMQSLLTAMVLNVKKLLHVVSRLKAKACRAAVGLGYFLSGKKLCSLTIRQCRFVFGYESHFVLV